jgi:hypothetical protein
MSAHVIFGRHWFLPLKISHSNAAKMGLATAFNQPRCVFSIFGLY